MDWLVGCFGLYGPLRQYFSLYRAVSQREGQCWLVGCFGFNGPLRQYFSLYRAVSQREGGGGRVVRRCWVNFQCQSSYNLDTVGQGPTALAVGAGGGCLDIFTLLYPFSPLSPSLWETAQYRLKYCLKGPLNPKQPTNQQTNQREGEAEEKG